MTKRCEVCGKELGDVEGFWWKIGDEIWYYCTVDHLVKHREQVLSNFHIYGMIV